MAACSGGANPPSTGGPEPAVVTGQPAEPAQIPGGEQVGAPASPGWKKCGPLDCVELATPEQGLDVLISESAKPPKVIAVGETHAQKHHEGVDSATKRFAMQLLPALADKSTDLVVELWVADKKCKKEKVEQVAKAQEPVTQQQSSGNQNEFVALGHRSKALGVVPHILTPSCQEYDELIAAGDDAIIYMLEMIARLTKDKVVGLLERQEKEGIEDKMVLAYGGAMHNDLAPREGREPWSFGPQLREKVSGRYVELDLIVPEYIGDTDTWKALPWYDHYDASKAKAPMLYRVADGTYVLFFAPGSSAPAADEPAK